MSEQDEQRGAHCAECEEWTPADGKQAGVTGGRFLCVDCIGEPVAFVSECLDCDWSYRRSGRSSDRYSVKQRVQQEANNHETREKHFESGGSHETVWREVEPTERERENPVTA